MEDNSYLPKILDKEAKHPMMAFPRELDDEKVKKDQKKGRRKINIEFIADKSRRHITFSKRKFGIMKKANELATLTGTQVLLLVVSETGNIYKYATRKLLPIVTNQEGLNLIRRCLSVPDMIPSSQVVPQQMQGRIYDHISIPSLNEYMQQEEKREIKTFVQNSTLNMASPDIIQRNGSYINMPRSNLETRLSYGMYHQSNSPPQSTQSPPFSMRMHLKSSPPGMYQSQFQIQDRGISIEDIHHDVL